MFRLSSTSKPIMSKPASQLARLRQLTISGVMALAAVIGLSPAPPAHANAALGCHGTGGYGFNIGMIQTVTPLVTDYDLIAYVETTDCTASQVTMTAVPAAGTPLTCTLYFPEPALRDATGCDNLLETSGVLEYGTTVKLAVRIVGVGTVGTPLEHDAACTVSANSSEPPGVLPYSRGDGPRCSFSF